MKPRTVALITPSVRLLGARRSLYSLAKALDRERYRPIVVCPSKGGLEEECRKAGIATRVLWLPAWRKGKHLPLIPFQLGRLRRWAQREAVALFHCNEIYPNPHAVRVGRRVQVPTVTHMRLSVTERMIRNYHLRRADRIVCVSQRASEPFRVWTDYNARVRVILNGVDVEEWRGAAGEVEEARAAVRKELGLAPETFLIGHLGLISRRKQQHLLVEAAKKIPHDCADWQILIVGEVSPGEPDYGERVMASIRDAGLTKRITVWPFRPNIEPVFAALDVNLLISSDEGFGRVAIEAGALGIPTIGTKVGGIPEVIRDYRTGLLIDVDDPAGLARAIGRLARDAELRRELGNAARDRVEREFTIQVHTRNVMNLYDEVLAGPGESERRRPLPGVASMGSAAESDDYET